MMTLVTCFSHVLAHTAVHTNTDLVGQDPTAWDAFLYKTITWDSPRSSFKIWPSQKNSLMSERLPRPPNKNTAGCMRSRLLTCCRGWWVFKSTVFLSWRSDTGNIVSNQQRYLCRVQATDIILFFFWYVVFIFKITKWILVWRSACGTWTTSFFFFFLEKKMGKTNTKKKTELHWCQLIWGFSVTCAVSNVGDVPATPTPHALRLVWYEVQ